MEILQRKHTEEQSRDGWVAFFFIEHRCNNFIRYIQMTCVVVVVLQEKYEA